MLVEKRAVVVALVPVAVPKIKFVVLVMVWKALVEKKLVVVA